MTLSIKIVKQIKKSLINQLIDNHYDYTALVGDVITIRNIGYIHQDTEGKFILRGLNDVVIQQNNIVAFSITS